LGEVVIGCDYCAGGGLVGVGLVIFPPPAVAFVMLPPAVIFPPVALPDMFCALTEAIPTTAAEKETTAAKTIIIKNLCSRIILCRFYKIIMIYNSWNN
jgi:hypothetical protein